MPLGMDTATIQATPVANTIPVPTSVSSAVPNVNEKEALTNFPPAQPSTAISGMEEADSSIDDTESLDSNCSIKKDVSPRTGVVRTSSRNITVQTLMQDGLLESGVGVLSIDYLGQKFYGDLLPTGKISWEDIQFASPSSWATFIKKRLNPSKKSGSGWNSVKYKGKKLDKLKSSWLQKNNQIVSTPGTSPVASLNDENSNLSNDGKATFDVASVKATDKRHANVVDPNMQIECETFNDAKPQPFSVVISSLVLAVVDFHCHMTTSEVVGYLGGKWEPTSKCLYILQAFPCRCKLYDQDVAAATELEIKNNLRINGLIRVGWYHSHISTVALPTLRDVGVQYDMQMMSNTHPTVGLICDPYFSCDTNRTESVCNMFWVMPNRNLDYPTPMKLAYSEVGDQNLPQEASREFVQLLNFYKLQSDSVSPSSLWKGTMTYLDKIQVSVLKRLAKDKSGVSHFIRELLNNNVVPSAAT